MLHYIPRLLVVNETKILSVKQESLLSLSKFNLTGSLMPKLLLPPSFNPRIEIGKSIHDLCNQLMPGAKMIPNSLTYWIVMNREESAEHVNSTSGTLKTWDSTKFYDLNPLKCGRNVVYRLYHLNQFLERFLIAR
jgi:hypothetical protein